MGVFRSVAIAVAFFSPPLHAQKPGGTTSSGWTGLHTVPTARTLLSREWTAGLSFERTVFKAIRLAFPDGARSEPWEVPSTRVSLAGAMGIGDRVETSAGLSWERLASEQAGAEGLLRGRFSSDQMRRSGLRNLKLGMKVRVLGDRQTWASGALLAAAGIPVGAEELGQGAWSWSAGAVLSLLDLAASAVWHASPEVGERNQPDEFHLGLGYSHLLTESAELQAETRWRLSYGDEGEPPDHWSVLVGPRLWFGTYREWTADAGAQVVWDASRSFTDWGLILRFSHFPRYDVLQTLGATP